MCYVTISNRILKKLRKVNKINKDYEEVYAYALEKLLAGIGNAILLIFTAFVFHIGLEMFVFLSFYMPIRRYAGGLHASTRTRCVIISLVLMVSLIKLSSILIDTDLWIIISLIVLSVVLLMVYKYAPVDTENKRLSLENRLCQGRKAKSIALFESVILIVCIFLFPGSKVYIMTATMSMLLVGITLLPYKKNNGGLVL